MLIEKAMAMGARDARLIPVGTIPVEHEIQQMCKSPRCIGYGQCANCPPYVTSQDESRIWIARFNEALIVKMDIPPKLLTSENHYDPFKRIFLIVTSLERIALKQGYQNASALGAGSCKPVFCMDQPCAVLQGKECRYPHLARPSLEAIGINVFKLAQRVGWKMYKILKGTDSNTVPSASLIGMVLLSLPSQMMLKPETNKDNRG
ncbi:MAG: hypothetical protein DRG71_09120 [Deltaproteobacteria bacterium]|nr:MAG: hypothetical protein DRG71_09120 [Deltaproteobacteria bacterium]